MNQSGRMENVRAALAVLDEDGLGVVGRARAAAALAEVEEWETRLAATETQATEQWRRAEAAEVEADRLKAALTAIAERDWVENVLDPQHAAMAARAALVPADRNTT